MGKRLWDGLRLAFGTLTIVPIRIGAADRSTAAAAMGFAPLVGLVLGALAAGGGELARSYSSSPLIAAVTATALLAVLTRALHLDGLADTADALGSGRPAAEALDVMKRSDIGPFGVMTLLLVTMGQIAAVSAAWSRGHGPAAVVIAATTGRLAITWSCRQGIPAARAGGLGAWVADSLPHWVPAAASIAVLVASAGIASVAGAREYAIVGGAAVLVGIGAGELLLKHCVRRFGGITGDVLGAVTETAVTGALIVLAAHVN